MVLRWTNTHNCVLFRVVFHVDLRVLSFGLLRYKKRRNLTFLFILDGGPIIVVLWRRSSSSVPRASLFLFALTVPFKRRRTFKIRPVASSILRVHHSATHFIRSLALFLRKDNFQLTSLDEEMMHFIPCFLGLGSRGILDKCKALRLLRMVVSGNINVANLPNATKGALQILCGNVRGHVSHQERNPRNGFVGLASSAASSSTSSGRATRRTSGRRASSIPRRRASETSIIVMSIVRRRGAIMVASSIVSWRWSSSRWWPISHISVSIASSGTTPVRTKGSTGRTVTVAASGWTSAATASSTAIAIRRVASAATAPAITATAVVATRRAWTVSFKATISTPTGHHIGR
mmetsp:Transcript_15044/g.32842  ORF Transcript_15044/g.32842 Transcript_15044/m.32842 type:complete len:348 (+) Transcript_15044:238-1281(+)